MERHRTINCMATVALALGALQVSAAADEQPDSAIRRTIENSVVVFRSGHSERATSEQDRSQSASEPRTAQQEADPYVETVENSVTVLRRESEDALGGGETAADSGNRTGTETEAAATTTRVVAVPSAAVTNPAPQARIRGWVSVRTYHSARSSFAWSVHANPAWSYHPHSLAYQPTRYRGYQQRRDWSYHPPRRTGYQPKRDWTYHRQ